MVSEFLIKMSPWKASQPLAALITPCFRSAAWRAACADGFSEPSTTLSAYSLNGLTVPRHTEAPVRIFFVLRLWLIPLGRCFASHYGFQKGCMLFSWLLLFGGTYPFLAPLDIGSPSLCGTSGYRTILVRPNVLGHCTLSICLKLVGSL